MGLPILDHLQPVLDAAQEKVGFPELVARARFDPAGLGEAVEHGERRTAAQRCVAAAEDELLGLDEEFDLADSAATELHVMPVHRDDAMALVRMDLPLDRVHVGERGEVVMLAPDERLELSEEDFPGLNVARGGPRLDEGGALPVLTHALVIGVCGFQRQHDRRRAGIGPQAQIETEHIAVGGALAHDPDDALRQPDEEIPILVGFSEPRARAIEQHDRDRDRRNSSTRRRRPCPWREKSSPSRAPAHRDRQASGCLPAPPDAR